MNKFQPARGEIWYANLEPSMEHEQGGTRPCLIISNNKFNLSSADLVIIAPITSRKKNIISHVAINPPEGGLAKPSFIMCEQLRTITKERLTNNALGNISISTIKVVEEHLRRLLGFQNIITSENYNILN